MTVKSVLVFNIVAAVVVLIALLLILCISVQYVRKRREEVARLEEKNNELAIQLAIEKARVLCLTKMIDKMRENGRESDDELYGESQKTERRD